MILWTVRKSSTFLKFYVIFWHWNIGIISENAKFGVSWLQSYQPIHLKFCVHARLIYKYLLPEAFLTIFFCNFGHKEIAIIYSNSFIKLLAALCACGMQALTAHRFKALKLSKWLIQKCGDWGRATPHIKIYQCHLCFYFFHIQSRRIFNARKSFWTLKNNQGYPKKLNVSY